MSGRLASDGTAHVALDKPSNSAPIRATCFRRTSTLCAVAILRHVRKHFSDVLFLTHDLCAKHGRRVDLAEAATLEYVRANTTISVPKVHCAFRHGGQTYIVMQKLPGRKLAHGWRSRSKESQDQLLRQLKTMIDELRTLKSPLGPMVANVDGGSLTDPRLPGLGMVYPIQTSWRFGPFEDIRAFHRWLRRPAYEVQVDYYPEVKELITRHETVDWGETVLTHGDLSSLNILVKNDKVTGIVDWEISGW